MNQILSSEERARIAAQYGCVKVPDRVQVIPRGVSGLPDPTVGISWKVQMVNSWRGRKNKAKAQPKPYVLDERALVIQRMVGEGATVRQMSAALGITDASIRERLKKLNLKAATPPRTEDIRVKRAQERKGRFIAAVAEGKTREQLCQEFNIGRVHLHKYAAYCGVKLQGPRRKPTPTVPWDQTEAVLTRRATVRSMFEAGHGTIAISRAIKASPKTVTRDIQAMGLRDPVDVRAKFQERFDRVLALRAEGKGYQEIIALTGCCRKDVHLASQRLGIVNERLPADVRRKRVRELHEAGYSQRQIMRELHVAFKTISEDLEREAV